MQQRRVKEIIKELALKYNMSIEDMTQICKAPLDFATHVIREKPNLDEGYFPSIRIQGFGVFYCTEGRGVQSGCIQSDNGNDANNIIQEQDSVD